MAETATIATPATKPELREPKPRTLPDFALKRPNEAMTVDWVVVLPEGYPFEDCLRSAFWAHVARYFDRRAHYFITVLNDEHSFYARLYVRAVQENQLIVDIVDPPKIFGPQATEKVGALIPKWNVGKRGYDVVRASDGQVVQDGSRFGVKEQALAWINDHLAKIAA